MERISFTDVETGSEQWFFVLEQTQLGGDTYLLVTDADTGGDDDEDAVAYILKAKGEDGENMTYEEVTDQKTLDVLSNVFDELLDDIILQ